MSLLAALSEQTINLAMWLGLSCFAGGILLMIHHRRQWLESLRNERHPLAILFETGKYRRRVFVAGLIASSGCGLIALYWARDPRALAAIIGLLLILLLTILALAVWDLLKVSFYKLGQLDKVAQRELMRKYQELKVRRQKESERAPDEPAESQHD